MLYVHGLLDSGAKLEMRLKYGHLLADREGLGCTGLAEDRPQVHELSGLGRLGAHYRFDEIIDLLGAHYCFDEIFIFDIAIQILL